MFFTLIRLYNSLIAQIFNKPEPHVSKCSHPVAATLIFHLHYNMLKHFLLILIKTKLAENQAVALHKLSCRKSYRYSRSFGMVFDKMYCCVYTSMYSTIIPAVLITKIKSSRMLPVSCYMNCMLYKFTYSFILSCRYRYYRNSKLRLEFIYMYRSSVGRNLIHHVKCKYHRYVKFYKLHCKVQVAFNISCIKNIYNCIRMFTQNKFSCYNLLTCIR